MQIKFGTDGWRAVMADGYTFDNLERVARATGQWLRRTYGDETSVVVGHDTRFQGHAFAEHAARALAAEGARVILDATFTPTPAISWATAAYGADAGVVITASHNPPEYNGFKIKASFGGPATPDMIRAVEGELGRLARLGETLPAMDDLETKGIVEVRDITSAYLDVLRDRLDIDAIRSADILIAHDAMYGAGQGLLRRLLGDDHVTELRSEYNPGFMHQAPEPIERNLGSLAAAIVDRGCDAGLANDGDADRLGMFDEQGQYVDPHRLLALLVRYLNEDRGLSGDIVKTVSTTHMLDRMGERYGLPVKTTPIGFKYIAGHIIDGDVLVGGEESGGIAVKGHLPERDGLYIGLLIVEMMVRRRKALSGLVQELYDDFGPHAYTRVDVSTTDARKRAVLTRLDQDGGLDSIGGRPVEKVDTLDGYKHLLSDGWLLVRPSGTEPVLRVYAEAPSMDEAQGLIGDALNQLGLADERMH